MWWADLMWLLFTNKHWFMEHINYGKHIVRAWCARTNAFSSCVSHKYIWASARTNEVYSSVSKKSFCWPYLMRGFIKKFLLCFEISYNILGLNHMRVSKCNDERIFFFDVYKKNSGTLLMQLYKKLPVSRDLITVGVWNATFSCRQIKLQLFTFQRPQKR